jgi:hypothetical protein
MYAYIYICLCVNRLPCWWSRCGLFLYGREGCCIQEKAQVYTHLWVHIYKISAYMYTYISSIVLCKLGMYYLYIICISEWLCIHIYIHMCIPIYTYIYIFIYMFTSNSKHTCINILYINLHIHCVHLYTCTVKQQWEAWPLFMIRIAICIDI